MKLNEGYVYTNDNCIGCNRCISGCPAPGANISIKKRNENRIYVDGEACIQCGKCLESCPHNAREYRDDAARFLEDLDAGEAISVLVAPSFFAVYGERADAILGRLKTLGVKEIYDVSYGADIATWAYLTYLEQNPAEGAIAPPCPASMNYIQKYSAALTEKILPIYSPVLCLASYIRKYVKLRDKLAFLGPCIAKKAEFEDEACEGLIRYNVTYKHLMQAFADKPLEQDPIKVDLSAYGLGRIYPIPGGLSANLQQFLPADETIREVHGVETVYDYLRVLERQTEEEKGLPHIVDCLNCGFGCLEGTGAETLKQTEDDVFIRLQRFRRPNPQIPEEDNPYLPELAMEERRERLTRRFAHLKLEDFMRSYCGNAEREGINIDALYAEDENKLDAVFREMHKDSEQDRKINCNSCGYSSCRDMAIAIARGHNCKENCVYYQKDHALQMALRDPRYDIYNSNAFTHFLEEMIARGEQEEYVCLLFNLQNFNRINQRYGHQQGDVILKLYCNFLGAMAREGEMVALAGGKSYLAAIRKPRLDWALDQLTNGVRVPFFPGDGVVITARVVVYWPQKQDLSSLMIMERLSLTYNMLQGTNKMVMHYDQKLRRQLEEEEHIAEMIEPALKYKEFLVYYQPKVDIQTRQITGAEALIRWKHGGEIIPPGRFIPVCEKRGLVEKLDFFVLESVCESISKWIADGFRAVPVSVNFSKQHFVNRDIADEINAVAEKYHTPRQYIEVEFTETAYMQDSEALIHSIDRLHEYGIASSMDDFGTGYSSLSMLQAMSFDTLKLDKSFLDNQRYEKQRGRAVIESIIKMAKQLNMTIVSEGIETEEDLQFMSSMSCDVAQGYLFDKPLERDAFEERLRREYYE